MLLALSKKGHSKSSTKAPLPGLSLYLDSSQDKVFKPNDIVSGRVIIVTPHIITPQAVEVTLWGESKVWIRTQSSDSNNSTDYKHYRDNAPLFAVTSNLLSGPCQFVPDQSYTFPFSFRIPEGTDFNRNGCYENSNDGRWTVFPHKLPPSFFFGHQDRPDNCDISYGVNARLLLSGFGSADPISSTAPILFQPSNAQALTENQLSVIRYPKNFTVQSSALTGIDPKSIGFRQRMHDRISSGTPKMDFELGIELPDVLSSGSEFRFRTTFDVLSKGEKVTHIPEITFKVLKLNLLDFTFFRAPRDWEALNLMSGVHSTRFPKKQRMGFQGQEYNIFREKKTQLNSLPEFIVMELPEVQEEGEKKGMEQAKHCETWFTARIPGYTPPSFTSFAISRHYRLIVKMGVECGGKKFEFETESHVKELGSAISENGI